MTYGKYIIVLEHGCKIPILFDSIIEHCKFMLMYNMENIISAGFFQVFIDKKENIKVAAFGCSTTLMKKAQPEDGEIIRKMIEGH